MLLALSYAPAALALSHHQLLFSRAPLASRLGLVPVRRGVRITSALDANAASNSSSAIAVTTFNLLCPAYRRIQGEPDEIREEQFPDEYIKRNQAILALPFWQDSDVVCCQEFWYTEQTIFEMYVNALSSRFLLHGMRRPQRRPDGLFMAVSRAWEVVHEADIDFEDAAGRCAQMLHLRRRGRGSSGSSSGSSSDGSSGSSSDGSNGSGSSGSSSSDGSSSSSDRSGSSNNDGSGDSGSRDDGSSNDGDLPSELIVANVHLLFPHNEASVRIRVREVHKLLTHLDEYVATASHTARARTRVTRRTRRGDVASTRLGLARVTCALCAVQVQGDAAAAAALAHLR